MSRLYGPSSSGDTAAESCGERESLGEALSEARNGLVIQVMEFVRNDNETLHFCQRSKRDPDMAMELAGRLEGKTFNDVRLD